MNNTLGHILTEINIINNSNSDSNLNDNTELTNLQNDLKNSLLNLNELDNNCDQLNCDQLNCNQNNNIYDDDTSCDENECDNCAVSTNCTCLTNDLSTISSETHVPHSETLSNSIEEENNKSFVQTQENTKVSFENIDPRNLQFKFGYRCSLSTAGQVIQGISNTGRYLSGVGEYNGNGKPITNKFQEYLYPKISEIANKIVTNYVSKFVTEITNPIKKEVYGANLNGSGNNGQLPNFITCVGVSRNVRYEYIQFKNVITLLHYRLNFIAKRDPQSIKRYRENEQERLYFEQLKSAAQDFCTFLDTVILTEWEEIKTEARKFNDNVAIKKVSTSVNPSEQEPTIDNKITPIISAMSNISNKSVNSVISEVVNDLVNELVSIKLTADNITNNKHIIDLTNTQHPSKSNKNKFKKVGKQKSEQLHGATSSSTLNSLASGSSLKRVLSSGEGWQLVEGNNSKNQTKNKFKKSYTAKSNNNADLINSTNKETTELNQQLNQTKTKSNSDTSQVNKPFKRSSRQYSKQSSKQYPNQYSEQSYNQNVNFQRSSN